MLQSCSYVWKIEKYGDEEGTRIANEKRTGGSKANDHGDGRKGS